MSIFTKQIFHLKTREGPPEPTGPPLGTGPPGCGPPSGAGPPGKNESATTVSRRTEVVKQKIFIKKLIWIINFQQM